MPFHAGSFLVARTTLKDAFFSQTVVLLLQHTAEGAFGLVVNQPAEVEGLPFPVFSGGPCPAEGLLMLHGHVEWINEDSDGPERTVAPGIFLGDAECLERAREGSPEEEFRFRVFNGYAGWGPDQLEGELAERAWAVVRATGEVLFGTPAEELWERLVPPSLPEFSAN